MAPQEITKPSDIPQSVPMFLRKTYHMIDSCDPKVACWSEDGETFVVKDPSKFESEIIPQFFKHSKFTSFVRQLNFYSFRKIKYVDTIRLDPKLEAETANFWRFRHEKFQRGKPHLLTEIKRMTASQNRAAAEKAAASTATSTAATATTNDSTQMKQEIDTLKKRLEEMNKNMTELTSMVQKVSLNDDTDPVEETALVHPGSNKRKKVEFVVPPPVVVPEPVLSDAAGSVGRGATTSSPLPLAEATLEDLLGGTTEATDDSGEALSLFPSDPMEMDAMDAALGMMLPTTTTPPQPHGSPLRASSRTSSNMTDTDFVDQLFDAFGSDQIILSGEGSATQEEEKEVEVEGDLLLPEPTVVTSSSSSSLSQQQQQVTNNNSTNHPDPELMDRLSEALGILPKEMQHQIVNRLIDSITSNLVVGGGEGTKAVTAAASDFVMPLSYQKDKDDDDKDGTPVVVAQTTTATPAVEKQEGASSASPTNDIGMPLAAATLASLLSYYSKLVKEKEAAASAEAASNNKAIKSIPVIPCHA